MILLPSRKQKDTRMYQTHHWTNQFAKAAFLLLLLGSSLLLVGGTASAVTPPSDQGDQVVTGGDLAFMNDAAPGGMAEVTLGKMAAEKASDTEVKKFGQKMVDDHSKAGEKLQSLAQKKGVALSTDPMPAQKEIMDHLSKLSGADFDRAYVAAMVTAHKKDVAAFQGVSKNATDADVKAFATETLPTLEMHLKMIQALATRLGVAEKD